MKDLLIKAGLNDEQITSVLETMKEAKLENIVERYNKLKNQKDDLKGQLDTANSTIEDLKKNNLDNETLQKTIKDHESTIETLRIESEAKIKNLTLNNAINNKLAKVDDKYKKLLETQFDKEKLTVKEDGSIEGLEEQFKTISETYKEWFEESTPSNTGGLGNFGRGNNNPTGGDSKSSFIDAIRNNSLRK